MIGDEAMTGHHEMKAIAYYYLNDSNRRAAVRNKNSKQ